MGKRLDNWLSKASTPNTREQWVFRWNRFTNWIISENNPLTDKPYLSCAKDEVDDVIRKDFEEMPSHMFQDKYRDILTKYVTSFHNAPSNTVASYVSGVRSFFSNEATSIKLQTGKVPSPEMAMNEHRFTLEELHRMWLVADSEGKARLSVAISLGWGVGDFLNLDRIFIEKKLNNVDEDGYVVFDYRRKKTKARIRGILNPCAVNDLKMYLPEIPKKQKSLWNARTGVGLNKWLKTLVTKAGIGENGKIRFHLIRKYVFDIVSSRCGAYEAKLLTGKTIPLADATYLHWLEDRLLERYKKFAYSFLNLNGQRHEHNNKIEVLEEKTKEQKVVLDYMRDENAALRTRVQMLEDSLGSLQTTVKVVAASLKDHREEIASFIDAAKAERTRKKSK